MKIRIGTAFCEAKRGFSGPLADGLCSDDNIGIKIRRPTLKPFSKDKFELVEPYKYKDIKIPVGYKTNGANIPRIFWFIFPPNSPEYLSAIVVHDWLCEQAAKLGGADEHPARVFAAGQFEAFKKADEILREMMTGLGCSKFKIYAFYVSCRIYHILKYGAKR